MAERLTDRGIAALKPTDASVLYFDSEVSGLAVRVYPSGRKVFVFDWRDSGRQRRVTIGQHPAWTVGKARTHASRMRLKADTGETVTPARGGRIADLIEQWRAVVKLTRRPGTVVGYCLAVDRYILPTFGKLEPKAITRNAIEQWHGEIAQTTPIQANRNLGVLSAFLSWLEHDRKIDRNPARGVRRRPENQRHVFLDADEIAAAHVALAGDNRRAPALALRMALLTGARIGEVLSLAPAQINAARRLWIKPASHTKQKKLHIVSLQAEALSVARELLALGLPDYESCTRCWERARALIGRPDVRIHDLRHSRASALARGGASLMQIGKVLGHSAPATTARYAHLVDRDLADLVERT
jgi:integrase